MVAAGCAAAAAILGFHVLKRNRAARLGADRARRARSSSAGCVLGGFLSSLVAVSRGHALAGAVARLVRRQGAAPRRPSGPSRPPPPAGRPPPPRHLRTRAAPGLRLGPSGLRVGPVRRQRPAGVRPAAAGRAPVPRPTAVPRRTPPPWPAPGAAAGPRPAAVLVACVVTWVFSSLAVLLMVGTALVVAADPDLLFDEMYRQNPDLADQGLTERLAPGPHLRHGRRRWSPGRWPRSCWPSSSSGAPAGPGSRCWRRPVGAGGLCLVGCAAVRVWWCRCFACVVTFSLLLRPDVRALVRRAVIQCSHE